MNKLGIMPLLTTNQPPRPDEKAHVEKFLLQEKADVLRLESQIRETEAILQHLRKQRDSHLQQMHGLAAILSPVRRLPTELLSKIFICVMDAQAPQSVSHRVFGSHKPLETKLLVCQICSRWRAVAIGTPELWKTLDIFITNDNLFRKMKQSDLATRFERVKVPGSMSINLSADESIDKDRFNPLAGVFLTQYVHLIGEINFFNRVFISFLSDFPLKFRPGPRAPDGDEETHELIHLHSMHLDTGGSGTVESLNSNMLNLAPWSQLTSLDILNNYGGVDLSMSLQTCIAILIQCSLLQRCEFSIQPLDLSNAPLEPQSPTTLEHLHTLRLTLTSCGPYVQLFEALTLPSLKTLVLFQESDESIDPSNSWDNARMAAFKARSSLDLEDLRFTLRSLTSLELMQFIEGMHSLKTLNVNDSGMFDSEVCEEFIDAMTIHKDKTHPRLAPKLESLNWIECIWTDHWHVHGVNIVDIFIPMIESRANSCLESVSLYFNGLELDETKRDALEKQVEVWRGRELDITIQW